MLAVPALCLNLIGCGGGSSSNSSGTGRAVIKITWPDRSRLLPLASNSIKVIFTRGAQTVDSQLIPRPASGNQTQTTFINLKTGSLTLTATAFPNSDGTGVSQASGTTPVTIQSGQTTAVTLTMASTIDHLEITPANPFVKVGTNVQLSATAKDSGGAVVLLSPSKLTWQSSDTSKAKVDTNGSVSAIAVGSADITVTDTESAKSVKTTVTVQTTSPITFQQPILMDTDSPGRVVSADFDGDGKMDFAIGGQSALTVFYGRGDGSFDPGSTVTTSSLAIDPYSSADMNGDGKPDLVCTIQSQILIFHNLGGRSFSSPVAIPLGAEIGALATGDFNNDGKPDIVIVVYDHPGNTRTDMAIFQNQGGGSYAQVQTVSDIWIIAGIVVGDLNGDGNLDVVTAIVTDIVGQSGAHIYWGDGAGHIASGPSIGTNSWNVNWPVVADFNRDGKQDFAISSITNGNLSVMFNQGGGTFTPPAYYGGGDGVDQLAAADMDGDGWKEIIAEDRGHRNITILRNENALFLNSFQVDTVVACGPIEVVDLNGDGKPDVIVSSPDNKICILINATQ